MVEAGARRPPWLAGPRSAVRVEHGDGARRKRIRILSDLADSEIAARLSDRASRSGLGRRRRTVRTLPAAGASYQGDAPYAAR